MPPDDVQSTAVVARDFTVKDCALLAIATGRKALTIEQLRDNLRHIDADSVYYHFWGNLVQPRFEEREYNNDFASWIRHALHDLVLAERLAVLAPHDYADLEDLRRAVLDLIEERLDEVEYLQFIRATSQFEFICSQIVVFQTRHQLREPRDLVALIPQLSPGSIFYHFIDARRRTPERSDDFSYWLMGFNGRHEELRTRLAGVDPYFSSLTQLRQELAATVQGYFAGVAS